MSEGPAAKSEKSNLKSNLLVFLLTCFTVSHVPISQTNAGITAFMHISINRYIGAKFNNCKCGRATPNGELGEIWFNHRERLRVQVQLSLCTVWKRSAGVCVAEVQVEHDWRVVLSRRLQQRLLVFCIVMLVLRLARNDTRYLSQNAMLI